MRDQLARVAYPSAARIVSLMRERCMFEPLAHATRGSSVGTVATEPGAYLRWLPRIGGAGGVVGAVTVW
jgi:hypothetical protein